MDLEAKYDLTFVELEKAVRDYIDFEAAEINRRLPDNVRPRQILHYLAKTYTNYTLREIGFRYGKKDHATVLHSSRVIINLHETDKYFRKHLDDICYRVNNMHSAIDWIMRIPQL